MIQKYRNPDAAKDAPLEVKSLGVLDPSAGVVVLVDEAHRSHSSTLHSVLVDALPNAARIGFTGTPITMGKRKRTHAIVGPYLDRYTIGADAGRVNCARHGRRDLPERQRRRRWPVHTMAARVSTPPHDTP